LRVIEPLDPRFFASASDAAAIFFAASSVSTFFTGKSAWAADQIDINKARMTEKAGFICWLVV